MSQVKESHDQDVAAGVRQRKELSMAQMATNAEGLQKEFEKRQMLATPSHQRGPQHQQLIPQTERDSSRKAFYKEFKKVVDESDVILEVLDARDPIGCRARAVEQAILEKGGKKIVLVLNKIDLVPREVVAAWLTHLRHEFPTVAFRCNTQSQKSHLSRGRHDYDTYDSLAGGGGCLGGDTLLELLKNYCRSQNLKKSITVGIIGYPNTGKSSLINSLKRSKAAAVGAKPGFTRQMKEIKLDANVVLLDCPGIVFGTDDGEYSNADIVLRNAVEMEKISDPVLVIDAVLKRCPRERLMELYNIPKYKSSEQFLSLIAHKIGKLKKGGVPDYKRAAVSVLRDWQSGKIKFYTMPPETPTSSHVVESTIVGQWAKEFDLDSIMQKEQLVIDKLPSTLSGTMHVASGGDRGVVDEMDLSSSEEYDQDDEDDEDDDGEEDAYAGDGAVEGAMAMFMPNQHEKAKPKAAKKRTEQEGGDEYDNIPVTRGKKTKQAKRDKKLKQSGAEPMDVNAELVEAPFDFDSFQPIQESNMTPEPENFEFNY